jgi:hydroxymethylglutaryl-CoA lyase
VRREREASLEDFKAIAARRNGMQGACRPRLLGGLSSAMGCAYEGAIDPAEVVECAVALAQAGADEIMIADTVGHASPTSVRQLFKAVIDAVAPLPVAAHFHDTRGLGLANVSAALDVGVRRFDASLAGLGGCQFVPNATGNIVMDDLCFMLESMGLRTGVDLNKLLAVRELIAQNLPSTPLYGSLARAGLPTGYQAHP